MTNIWQDVQRERQTEDRVRAMDVADLVELLHELEDRIQELETEQIQLVDEYNDLYEELRESRDLHS